MALDPAADAIPLALAALDPAPVVLLLDATHASAWAADAAISLAAAWAQAGRRIVLADLHLEEPVLHERLGETNRDGVVDIFLYGASLARSARPVPEQGFYLIPAGTYAADSGAIFRHPRWPKLLAGFRDARASLLLFAPVELPELAALAQGSAQAVLLAEPEKQPEIAASLPAELTVVAALTPPASEEVPAAHAVTSAEAPIREPGEAPLPGEAGAVREEPTEADGDLDPPPAAPAPGQPLAPIIAVEARERLAERAGRRGSSAGLWIALGLLLLVIAGALLLYLRPDLLQSADSAPATTETARAGLAESEPRRPPATVAATLLPYAVHLMAFRSHGAAREQVAVEERRLADEPVYVSPELIQGILYYRVLAGFPADSAAALRLRQRLLDAGAIDPEDAAGSLDLIQYAPLAFQLGEFSTRQAALARADSLVQLGIPSYPAAVPYSDGSERWRLYGGAFRDSLHAEGMQELLGQAGLEPPLVERLGKPTTSTP